MLVVPVQFFSYSPPAARRADIVGRHPKAPPSVANTWPGGAPQKDHDGFLLFARCLIVPGLFYSSIFIVISLIFKIYPTIFFCSSVAA